MHADPLSPALATQLDRLTSQMLSPVARYGHVALLLVASAMLVAIGSLLLTETGLPARTQAAFSAMLLIAASWMIYAGWVLRHRRPLFARHRIVAGRMAVTFTAVFFAAAIVAVIRAGGMAATAAAVSGACMLTLAIATLIRARRDTDRLEEERARLQGALDASSMTR